MDEDVEFIATDDEIQFVIPDHEMNFRYTIPTLSTIEQARSFAYELYLWRQIFLGSPEPRDMVLLNRGMYEGVNIVILNLGTLNLIFATGAQQHIDPSIFVVGMPAPYRIERLFYTRISGWLKDIELRAIAQLTDT